MTTLMSFWPSVFENIESQSKLIEYRRTFPKNCTYAYMYVSKPVKSICGIIYFGRMWSIEDWKALYAEDKEVLARIENYNKGYRYAMEITGFQQIRPITLADLKSNVDGFCAPQSYLLLENNRILADYIKRKTVMVGKRVDNDLSNVFPEHICKRY